MSEARQTELLEDQNTTLDSQTTLLTAQNVLLTTQTDVIVDSQEEITLGIKSINTDHALIHMGYGLGFTIYKTLTTGQVFNWSFKAPTAKYAHVKDIQLTSLGGSIKLALLEGVVVTVDTGTLVPLNNLNNNSLYVPTTTIKETPTFTGGAAAWTIYALADSTNQTTGIGAFAQNENKEFVTKSADTYYVLQATNLTTESIPIVISGFLYEESQGLV